MTVKAGDRYDEASDIARRRRGYDYQTRNERSMREREREESQTR
jgi:hypothetical protein